MANLLLIETGTEVCSVALVRNGQIAALKENSDGRAHARLLAPFIDEVLREGQLHVADLSAVAVSEGPGSYTGLRVGVSTAKGICFGAGKPLIAVGSLQSLAQLAIDRQLLSAPDCLIAPMIDARRMEVYTALYDAQGTALSAVEAKIIDEHSFAEALAAHPVLFLGDGAGKCRPLLQHPNARFADTTASAAGLLQPALQAFHRQHFVDLAYFEPFYLKEFVATGRTKSCAEN